MKATLVVPCFVDTLFPEVAEASVEVLKSAGFEVEFAEGVLCCGQPLHNAGFAPEASRLVLRAIKLLENAEAVVIPSGSCASMIRNHYRDVVRPDRADSLASRTFEVGEFLVAQGKTDLGAKFPHRVAVHTGCHAKRELALEAHWVLLDKVEGLDIVDAPEASACCGFGGLFAMKNPEISVAMGETKLAGLLANQPEYVVSTDSSCLMHLAGIAAKQGRPFQALHYLEVLSKR